MSDIWKLADTYRSSEIPCLVPIFKIDLWQNLDYRERWPEVEDAPGDDDVIVAADDGGHHARTVPDAGQARMDL